MNKSLHEQVEELRQLLDRLSEVMAWQADKVAQLERRLKEAAR